MRHRAQEAFLWRCRLCSRRRAPMLSRERVIVDVWSPTLLLGQLVVVDGCGRHY